MSMNEQRVRELAYQIWQSEGCPDGEHHRHWDMACRLAEAELQPSAAQMPASRTRKTALKPTEATAASMPAADTSLIAQVEVPVKPRATRTKASAAASPAAATEAAAGTPEAIKKPRAPRKKKDA